MRIIKDISISRNTNRDVLFCFLKPNKNQKKGSEDVGRKKVKPPQIDILRYDEGIYSKITRQNWRVRVYYRYNKTKVAFYVKQI